MANSPSEHVQELMAAPLGELIASIGEGVAEAQKALDTSSIAQFLEIYSNNDDSVLNTLREIGYQPSFYTLPETEVEAKVSIALSTTSVQNQQGGAASSLSAFRTYATPVNSTTQNKFNLNAEASATLKFKIVAVPPAAGVPELRVMPALEGKPLSEAEALLNQLGIQYNKEELGDDGSKTIAVQQPAAGQVIRRDDAAVLSVNSE